MVRTTFRVCLPLIFLSFTLRSSRGRNSKAIAKPTQSLVKALRDSTAAFKHFQMDLDVIILIHRTFSYQ
jgi:hypothetical protein